jgi:5-oxoprolinase (ATP-hydrolysing)
MLEIFNNLFMSIAEQMGVTLQNTAYSVNIKERLDFSCAVFDADRRCRQCAAYAGASGLDGRSVETIIRLNDPAHPPGDVFALNAPYNGGTHLPDITVCTPVFDEKRQDDPVLGRLARPSRRYRRHHAGLDEPPARPRSRRKASISTISCWSIAAASRARTLRAADGGPYPARNPLQNVNDLKAQIAANEKGARELARMVEQFGSNVVEAYMGHVQDNAAESVRRVIDR